MKAIGFDLGETLLYYEDVPMSWDKLYRSALQQVAYACGCLVDEQLLQAGEAILARYNTRLTPRVEEVTSDQLLGEILRAWGSSAEPATAAEAFFTYFQRRVNPYPETVETLNTLKKMGLRIGILTDVPYGMTKAFVQRDLVSIGIDSYVDALITSVEVGLRKPSVKGFFDLAERLDATPESMLYVGNEEKDVTGASNAGLLPILVDRAGNAGSYGEKVKIKSLQQLLPLLAGDLRAR